MPVAAGNYMRRTIVGRGDSGGLGKPAGPMLPGLKRARARKDYTLVRLAELSGVHSITISRLENLKRGADLKTVYRLARALEVPEEELIGEGQSER